MFKVEIKKDNVITNQASFSSEGEAQVWLDQESAKLSFGKIQREVREIEKVDSEGIITIALDNNEDISKSVSSRTETLVGVGGVGYEVRLHTLPADFISAIIDITAEVLAQKESSDALRYLEMTDYKVLRHIREKALNVSTTLSEIDYLTLEQSRDLAASKVL
jgi:hypothetical protein